MIDVSIILVNYKTSFLVKNVISSIKEESYNFSYEIIIVDNSQDNEEYQKLLENKDAIIINSGENLGFGKANNLGAKSANGKYLYFLNTDTLLMNNSIYELKKFLDDNNNVSIVGSNLYKKDGTPNHSFISHEINYNNIKKSNFIFPLIKKFFNLREDFNNSDSPLKIFGYVSGASLMIKKNDFDLLEGFDKNIFMYSEEVLLCYRVIHELGKCIYNIPSSRVMHFEGASFENSINYSRYKVSVDGESIYYLKAFGKEETLKILKLKAKQFHNKAIISRFLFKKEKYIKFKTMQKATLDKINEILNL